MDRQVTGAVRSPLDERDHQWEEVAMGIPSFDWDAGYDIEEKLGRTLSPKDQNGSFSCGGQAWAVLAAVQEALYTKTLEERSAKFIYSQTAVYGGGSSGRANSEVYTKKGVSLETLCPSYENGKAPTEAFMIRSGDISSTARENAAEMVRLGFAKSYTSISPDINSIAQALKANGGVVIGIDGRDNGTWYSEFPKAPKDGSGIWRHWLYVGKAKTIKGKRYLGVLNSWGPDAGKNGWQWISEDYVNDTVYDTSLGLEQDCVWEAWTTVYNTEGVPEKYTHNFTKDIAYGQRGEEVRALQLALQVDGSFPAGYPLSPAAYPVAYYGDMTAAAVVKFRAKHGVDGSTDPKGKNAGPRTRAKLNELFK